MNAILAALWRPFCYGGKPESRTCTGPKQVSASQVCRCARPKSRFPGAGPMRTALWKPAKMSAIGRKQTLGLAKRNVCLDVSQSSQTSLKVRGWIWYGVY